jgi:hypothetical protein
MSRACSTHGEKKNACRSLMGSQKKRDHYEDQYVDGRIIFKRVLEK